MTCQAVEDVSREAVAKVYGDEVSFTGYNLEDDEGKQKGQELGVYGQTLLIVSGEKKINITSLTFSAIFRF